MGFFNFFGNLSEEISKFADAGMQMNIDELIYRMSRTSKKTEVMGYKVYPMSRTILNFRGYVLC